MGEALLNRKGEMVYSADDKRINARWPSLKFTNGNLSGNKANVKKVKKVIWE